VKQWHWITLAILVVISMVAGLLGHHEPGQGHWWDAIPGFYAVYGFAGSCAVIYLARLLGRWFLQRDEDYYYPVERDVEEKAKTMAEMKVEERDEEGE